MENIHVENMTSRNGNKVANQFVITQTGTLGTKKIFQSYDTVIAVREYGKIFLDRFFWDYSVTTGKYRNIFLNENIKETREKIASGEYILTDLNNSEG